MHAYTIILVNKQIWDVFIFGLLLIGDFDWTEISLKLGNWLRIKKKHGQEEIGYCDILCL